MRTVSNEQICVISGHVQILSHILIRFHRIMCPIQYLCTYKCESQALLYGAGITLCCIFVNTVMSIDGCFLQPGHQSLT